MKTTLLFSILLTSSLSAFAAPNESTEAINGAKSLAHQVIMDKALSSSIEKTYLSDIRKSLEGGSETGSDGAHKYDTGILSMDCTKRDGGLGHSFCSILFSSNYEGSGRIRDRYNLNLDVLTNGVVSSADIEYVPAQ